MLICEPTETVFSSTKRRRILFISFTKAAYSLVCRQFDNWTTILLFHKYIWLQFKERKGDVLHYMWSVLFLFLFLK